MITFIIVTYFYLLGVIAALILDSIHHKIRYRGLVFWDYIDEMTVLSVSFSWISVIVILYKIPKECKRQIELDIRSMKVYRGLGGYSSASINAVRVHKAERRIILNYDYE